MTIVVFDLDHTLIKKNSSYAFGKFLYQKRFFSSVLMLKLCAFYGLYQCKCVSLANLHNFIFKHLFKDHFLADFQNEAENFLNIHLHHLLDPLMQEKLDLALKNNYVVLLSSSPDFLVKKIAAKLSIPYAIGSSYTIDIERRFQSLAEIIDGRKKAIKIQNLSEELRVPRESIIAYSDSWVDIPLLSFVGIPIAVNPDRELQRKSLNKGWEILRTR
jgi:HAD superfamily phosphoserine phosphatase-like hydrolase